MKKYFEREDEFRKIAEELVSKMTIEEVAEQLLSDAPAIERLGVEAYNYWNEGLHGLARSGTATVFPQSIALAAMFDEEMLKKVADIVSTECRARYNESSKRGDRDIYKGLTLWSPNINIFRDQRWGRGQETYGEDPYLTSVLGKAFINGLQGDGEFLKTSACAKHFAVHSGPENIRHEFDAVVSKKDLEETYLPAFEVAVKEAKVENVMGAYNRVNSEPACGSEELLVKKLRNEWGFKGHVVSDCYALQDFHLHHKVTKDAKYSAKLALEKGCDINCGGVYKSLMDCYKEGLVTEEMMRKAAVRAFRTRAKLGMFSEKTEYDDLGILDMETKESMDVSYRCALNSQVLLKNDGTLPLDKNKIKTIGVIGPNAASIEVLNGNYNGTSSDYITNLAGIKREVERINKMQDIGNLQNVSKIQDTSTFKDSSDVENLDKTFNKKDEQIRVLYSEGSHLYKDRTQGLAKADDRISEAVAITEKCDVVIMCLGLDATIEGEEGDAGNEWGAGDKKDLYLPDTQRRLYKAVVNAVKENSANGIKTKLILVINAGSGLDISKESEAANAVLYSWYSGAHGGRAVSDIIFGNVSPSAKLPVTFSYEGDLPKFTDYSMKDRTYRYSKKEALFPFGYGLSYTEFEYINLRINQKEDISLHNTKTANRETDNELVENMEADNISENNILNPDKENFICVNVKNTGEVSGDEVVEVYISNEIEEKISNGLNKDYKEYIDINNQPQYSLCGFKRVHLNVGEEKQVNIKLDKKVFTTVLENGKRVILKGKYKIYVGGSLPDKKSEKLLNKKPLSEFFFIN